MTSFASCALGERRPIDEESLGVGALSLHRRGHQAFDRIGHVMRLIEHVGRIETRRAAVARVDQLIEDKEQTKWIDRPRVEIVVAVLRNR